MKLLKGTNTKYCAVGEYVGFPKTAAFMLYQGFCFGAPWVFEVAGTDLLSCGI